DGDSLRENSTNDADTFEVTYGVAPDQGIMTGFSTGDVTGNPFAFVPISFQGFRGFLVDPNGGATATVNDTLIVNGTAADDTFSFNAATPPFGPAFPAVVVDTGAIVHTPIFYNAALGNIRLRGLDGNDTFNLSFNPLPGTVAAAIRVEG